MDKKLYLFVFFLVSFFSCFSQSSAENFIYNRAVERAKLMDYKGAMQDFSKLIELNPKNESAYNSRGLVKLKLHDPKGAMEDFSTAIELAPDFGSAYYNKGMLELNSGLKESAYNDLIKAQQFGYEKAGEAIQQVSFKP